MEADPKPPTVWASVGTTVNLGNFENAKIDLGMSNVPVDISDEEFAARMLQAKKVLNDIVNGLGEELNRRIDDLRS